MFSFKEFFFFSEGKHEIIDGHKLGPDSPEEFVKKALNHGHAGVIAYGVRHYSPEKHPNLAADFDAATKHKDWWVRAEAARNKHLTDEQRERLSNDSNSKVKNAFGETASEKPVKTKEQPVAIEKPKKQKAVPTPKPKKEKAAPSTGISVKSGNPDDFGLPNTSKVSHVTNKGKHIATAISSVRPAFGELDRDTLVHQAFVGDHTKEDGLKHVGNYRSHQEALIAAAKATKK